MKNPLTARRERRVLAAITHLGPIDDFELYRRLNAFAGTLTKPLINLAAAGLITSTKCNALFLSGDRMWQLTEIKADDEDGD